MTAIEKAKAHFNYGINYDIFSEPVRSYAKMAVIALEKQIPKKPIKDEYGFLHCPYCDYDDYSLMHDSSFSDRYNYCCYCGQALDWSDRE